MSSIDCYISQEGFDKLTKELNHLKEVERPIVIAAIASSRALGDLSENAEYHGAKKKQSAVESRIKYLELYSKKCIIVNTKVFDQKTVNYGARVEVLKLDDEKKSIFKIVSEYEGDLSGNLISVISPLGKAMLYKKVSDYIEVSTPKGLMEYEILKIEY